MAKPNRTDLLDLFERCWDYHSSRSILAETLAQASLDGHDTFDGPELERMAALLVPQGRRAEWLVGELRRQAGTGSTPAAKPTPAVVTEPPAAPLAPALTHKPAAHAAPAAAKAPVHAATGTHDGHCHATDRLEITEDRAGHLRWGVNNWKTPAASLQPVGSAKVADSKAVETPLHPSAGHFTAVVGPFGDGITEFNYVVRFDDGTWAPDTRVVIGQ